MRSQPNFTAVMILMMRVILTLPAAAWSNYHLAQHPYNVQNLEMIVPETGIWAGYPLVLTKGDTICRLIWIKSISEPLTIGHFKDLEKPKLICDPTGCPVIVDKSYKGLFIYVRSDDGWNYPLHFPITDGNEYIIPKDFHLFFDSEDNLIVDYSYNENLNRFSVDLTSKTFTDNQIRQGYDEMWSDGHSESRSVLKFYPGAFDIWYRNYYYYYNDWKYGLYTICTGGVSIVPGSEIEDTICPLYSKLYSHRGTVGGWIAAWTHDSVSYFVQSSSSGMGELELSDWGSAVDAFCADEHHQGIVWTTNDRHLLYKDCLDGEWCLSEPLFDQDTESIQLAIDSNQEWVLFQNENNNYLTCRNEFPATPTPNPAWTPAFTPLPSRTDVQITMSAHHYQPDQLCWCRVAVTNAENHALENHPLFVVLDVAGSYFFGPSFSGSADNYLNVISRFQPGVTIVSIIEPFLWPSGCGQCEDIRFVACMTTPDGAQVIGDISTFEFGWTE